MKTDINHSYEIAGLILSYLKGNSDAEKHQRLEAWLKESAANRELFASLTDEELQNREVEKILSYDVPYAWQTIQQKVLKRKQRRRLWLKISKIAAIATILVSTPLALYLKNNENPSSQEIAAIRPGKPMARLTVGNGTTYILDTLTNIVLPNTSIRNGNEIIFSEADSTAAIATKYNKLEIPRGGEYRITLSDGTSVFLNSQTELQFPENFTGKKERIVYLSGEAFFQVAKNEKQPFVVKCADYDVKVLGTSFNISDYADDNYSHTTLKSGKVEIRYGSESIALAPGQQALLKEGQMGVREVNVKNYTTWMEENFRFEQENIDNILKRIARWYAVEIFYANPSLKEYHFTGYLPRYANISEVLGLLSLTTNIRFEVKGKTVVVINK